ncbi:secondary thiamine-phosphate synthase enzyme YjbQ [Perlabentimonas gracilis]|uniref:secondary thiamine-phosphate synthase enzyme YjbQ n=1 Tax=Perlabentimonas gracilis TaxID=2715279 RepID=UPI00140DCB5D|nr:secondary thiamine-phosphate synthase enzyme YjbQ [Perlabentimonas gracilis]NHB67833.1 YjbQ family protein [Perlabentimonas gracilis]
MVQQVNIKLPPFPRGFHLVTHLVEQQLPTLPNAGVLHLFIQHTSAGITINENADPTVRDDFNEFFNRLVQERQPWFKHNYEGDDDMPAHLKASLVGFNVTIPIINGALNLGTWQGIYLCEFRNRGGVRRIIASIVT